MCNQLNATKHGRLLSACRLFDDSVHTVTVPTDGQEDALQLQDIMQLHLETLQAGNTCEDTEWLHMMLVQRDVLCPCLHDCFDTSHILT